MSEMNHSGIKGMKWGVRRFQNADGTLTAAGKERYSSGGDGSSKDSTSGNKTVEEHPDHAKTHDNKPVESMSDAELRERLNRIDMEQRYNKANPANVKRGKELFDKALKVATTASTVIGTGVAIAVNVDKIIGWINGKPISKG